MNLLVISKYPPIEGGVASTTYWFARALGKRGHKVHIVTNANLVEPEFRELIPEQELHLLEPKNVFLHNLKKDFVSPIPDSQYYSARLSSLSLDVIKKYDIDVIYSFYLLPYGVAGMLAKLLARKPFVVRNAGSDIGRHYRNPELKTLLTEVLRHADYIHGAGGILKVLDAARISLDKLVKFGHGAIDTEVFSPGARQFDVSGVFKESIKDKPVLTFIGKIQQIKAVDQLIASLSSLRKLDYAMLFVCGSDPEVLRIKRLARAKNISRKCLFLPFQPPWRIPSIMKLSSCVILPESSEAAMLPDKVHYPIIGREALSCGKCVILGAGISERGYYKILRDGHDFLRVDPANPKEFTKKLRFVIEHPEACEEIGRNARKFSLAHENPASYYDRVSDFFRAIAKKQKT